MTELEQKLMYAATCRCCLLAAAMRDCPHCVFNVLPPAPDAEPEFGPQEPPDATLDLIRSGAGMWADRDDLDELMDRSDRIDELYGNETAAEAADAAYGQAQDACGYDELCKQCIHPVCENYGRMSGVNFIISRSWADQHLNSDDDLKYFPGKAVIR